MEREKTGSDNTAVNFFADMHLDMQGFPPPLVIYMHMFACILLFLLNGSLLCAVSMIFALFSFFFLLPVTVCVFHLGDSFLKKKISFILVKKLVTCVLLKRRLCFSSMKKIIKIPDFRIDCFVSCQVSIHF